LSLLVAWDRRTGIRSRINAANGNSRFRCSATAGSRIDYEVDRLGAGLPASICTGGERESDICILSDPYPGNEPQDRTVWIGSKWAFVLQTHRTLHAHPIAIPDGALEMVK
jgi:hypothetical protein